MLADRRGPPSHARMPWCQWEVSVLFLRWQFLCAQSAVSGAEAAAFCDGNKVSSGSLARGSSCTQTRWWQGAAESSSCWRHADGPQAETAELHQRILGPNAAFT